MNIDRNLFKKIYIEITNTCNLNCTFCTKTIREKKTLSIDEFKIMLNKVKPYTKYLYFHVLGEPLIHPNINKLIDLAAKDFYVNITTNGYVINNIIDNKNVRQINISLHSFSTKYNKSLDEYLSDIFNYVNKRKPDTFINFRLWASTKYFNNFIEKLEKEFNTKINLNEENNTLSDNVFLNFKKEFIWPQNNQIESNKTGICYALSDHIAILSDGTITACCIDANGDLKFGNIFNDSLEDIINSQKFNEMKTDLKNGIRKSDLCKKCNFL